MEADGWAAIRAIQDEEQLALFGSYGIECRTLPKRRGHQFTADPQMEIAIEKAAIRMPRIPKLPPTPPVGSDGQFAQILKETITAPCDRDPIPAPTPQVITQEQIDEALRQYSERKAREKGEADDHSDSGRKTRGFRRGQTGKTGTVSSPAPKLRRRRKGCAPGSRN